MQHSKDIYGHIDNVEFFVGLFAEEKIGKATFSSFVFSLITTSKLLKKDWNKMITPIGKQIVNKFTTVYHLFELHTNLRKGEISLRISGKRWNDAASN